MKKILTVMILSLSLLATGSALAGQAAAEENTNYPINKFSLWVPNLIFLCLTSLLNTSIFK
jgi:hypothetical protein